VISLGAWVCHEPSQAREPISSRSFIFPMHPLPQEDGWHPTDRSVICGILWPYLEYRARVLLSSWYDYGYRGTDTEDVSDVSCLFRLSP